MSAFKNVVEEMIRKKYKKMKKALKLKKSEPMAYRPWGTSTPIGKYSVVKIVNYATS